MRVARSPRWRSPREIEGGSSCVQVDEIAHAAARERVRKAYWTALDESDHTPAEAEQGLRVLVGGLEREYPSAAACLADDLEALCVHLRYPGRLRKRLRSSNLLERPLEEVQRRVKVIGRFPGETSCLSLCWAVLELFMSGAGGLGLTNLDRQQLDCLRAERQPASPTALSASA